MTVTVTCDWCGEDVEKYESDVYENTYCDQECHTLHRIEENDTDNRAEIECPECNEIFVDYEYEYKELSTHCSIECKMNANKRKPVPHMLENQNGYEQWVRDRKVAVHQLLAISDGGDPWKVFGNDQYQVHHKNGCKIDNRAENIEVVTTRENGVDGGSRTPVTMKYTDLLEIANNIYEDTRLSIEESIQIIEENV
jgi:hypothetical protein